MKKRLRKKLHKKEFKEIGFEFNICFASTFDKEKRFETIYNIYDLIEQHGFVAGGISDGKSCQGFMAIHNYRVNATEQKEKLRIILLAVPGVTSVEFGKDTDAWYGPFT